MAKAERFVQIKVTLNDIRPSATTLEDLHFIILAAMGWQGGHLHAFRAAERQYRGLSQTLAMVARRPGINRCSGFINHLKSEAAGE